MIGFQKRLTYLLLVAVGILLIPIVAMQFTDEVKWGSLDFLVAGVLLIGTAFGLSIIAHKVEKKQMRFILAFGLILLLLITWIELAVGLF